MANLRSVEAAVLLSKVTDEELRKLNLRVLLTCVALDSPDVLIDELKKLDGMQFSHPTEFHPFRLTGPTLFALSKLPRDHKVEGVKLIRAETHIGLKAAKDLLEYLAHHRILPQTEFSGGNTGASITRLF